MRTVCGFCSLMPLTSRGRRILWRESDGTGLSCRSVRTDRRCHTTPHMHVHACPYAFDSSKMATHMTKSQPRQYGVDHGNTPRIRFLAHQYSFVRIENLILGSQKSASCAKQESNSGLTIIIIASQESNECLKHIHIVHQESD